MEKFKGARKTAGLSQTELAKASNVSQQLIGEIESGRARTSKAIYRIAEALKTAAHELDDDIPAPDDEWSKAIMEARELPKDDQEYALNNLKSYIAVAKKRARRIDSL